MGTPAAPRIDDRLRRYIAGSDFFARPADVTRGVGELAWQLGLPRPSYEQVRALMGGANRLQAPIARPERSTTQLVLRGVSTGLNVLYEYPGPGLADLYQRYKRGLL
jgi:hypothetical protein